MKPYYEHAGITIYHGDCRDVLPSLEPVDLVLTDPPYGNGSAYASYEDTLVNLEGLITAVWPLLRAKTRTALVTCGVGNIIRWPVPDWTLAWFTPAGAGSGPWGFCCWQPVLAYGKDPYLTQNLGRRPDALVLTKQSEVNGHPCPKPIEIMRWLVLRGTTDELQTIMDPFMGSGTTLRAAKDLRRRAIGIEIEERYCEIAVKRLSQEVLL